MQATLLPHRVEVEQSSGLESAEGGSNPHTVCILLPRMSGSKFETEVPPENLETEEVDNIVCDNVPQV